MNIFVAGHNGMVGKAICNELLKSKNDINLIKADKQNLDLLNQHAVKEFFKVNQIDQIYIAAAKVGGIYANDTYPADFLYENIMIQSNLIQAAHDESINKLLFLGSSCIYPKFADQPIKEESLMTGPLERTNEAYAIAKICGIKACESYNRQYGRDYRCLMPTNLYGPHDNFNPKNSHVIPGLIQRFHDAKQKNLSNIKIWGTGNPKREFLHVDDLAVAAVKIMNLETKLFREKIGLSYLNVGCGFDISIKELAEMICYVTGFDGKITFDQSKADGTPQKLLDISKIKSIGWKPKIELEDGIASTYRWYRKNISILRKP
tara:strand:+ start:23496 stop:24452 length:957 start_codon:yes stop_codon:yes gene_type:complete